MSGWLKGSITKYQPSLTYTVTDCTHLEAQKAIQMYAYGIKHVGKDNKMWKRK